MRLARRCVKRNPNPATLRPAHRSSSAVAVVGTGQFVDPARRVTLEFVQLQVARLCLDCEEVHDEYRCPACASDQFSYLTRWVPGRDRPKRPRPKPAPPPEADVYRQLIHGEAAPPRRGRLVTRALMGLGAAAGLASVFLGARSARAARDTTDESSDASSDESR
jgi:hypothetical protein